MAVGFQAEDVVEFVEDGGAGEFGAVLVGHLGIGRWRRGFGGGVAVFLEIEGLAGDAGQGGQEAEVDSGIGLGIGDGELGEEFAHADGGELEGEVLDIVGLIIFGEVAGEIEPGGEDFEAVLVAEPVLVTAAVPGGDVLFEELVGERRVGGFIEALEDLGVGGAVGEELVDEVAQLGGETGDFAIATATRVSCELADLGQGDRQGRRQCSVQSVFHAGRVARVPGQRLSG